MSRLSPSVLRVVAILNFFADHPGQSFRLTDLVNALKLSRATCHSVLAALIETGYLYRSSDKSYMLGPALINVGEVASEHYSPLQVARPEMRKLADEYDGLCVAAFREHHDVVVRERAAAGSLVGYPMAFVRDVRRPLLPQFAGPYFVSSSKASVKAWVEAIDPPSPPEQVEALIKGIDYVREHGYLYGIFHSSDHPEANSDKWLQDRRYFNTPVIAMFDLVPAETYHLSFISVPVYDARHKVAFALVLTALQRSFTGVQVESMAARVCEVASRISSSMKHLKGHSAS